MRSVLVILGLMALVAGAAERRFVYNTDGCDVYLYPNDKPITEAAFRAERLDYAKGSNITTISYCPQSSGFGYFTCGKAGDTMRCEVRRERSGKQCHNATMEFLAKGLDPLEMTGRFCREYGKEFFLSIRMNDTHDAVGSLDKPDHHFSPFKKAHPECLFGTGRKEPGGRPPFCNWSAVDFGRATTREYMKNFVRQFVTNYDLDGIEYDFNRHMQLLRSVSQGGQASAAELEAITQFMRDLRAITEAAAQKRGRRLVILVRMPDSIDYLKAVGIDAEKWFAEKLVDGWIGAGYFRLNRWKTSADIAHKYGLAFYASLDEPRVEELARKQKRPYISGRTWKGAAGRRYYGARMSEAIAEGCDGVYLFNLEAEGLRNITKLNPFNLEDEDKIYYASARGSGGYQPFHYLKDGLKFSARPKLDPRYPLKLYGCQARGVTLVIGDEKADQSTIKLATALKENEKLEVAVNDVAITLTADKRGFAKSNLKPGTLHTGANTIRMQTVHDCTIYDLSLEINKTKERSGR